MLRRALTAVRSGAAAPLLSASAVEASAARASAQLPCLLATPRLFAPVRSFAAESAAAAEQAESQSASASSTASSETSREDAAISNLRLDKKTQQMLARQQALDQGMLYSQLDLVFRFSAMFGQ